MDKSKLHYYEQMSELYPSITKASAEIINLQAIMNLPKGTEHFLSDIHGEYDAFSHVLRNGSGAVRKKIDDVFGNIIDPTEKTSLATLIYYPKEKMALIRKDETEDMDEWYRTTIYRLIEICKTVSSKYTRARVRRFLPADYAYVIEELITVKPEVLNKEAYYASIVNTIVELGRSEEFIIALSELIQTLSVDHLHILGDIYDRGSGAHLIMDRLCSYHSVDIQWGNHDIIWMGAAAGQEACVATVVRNSIRYGNIDFLEDGYGINLMPLGAIAMEVYGEDPCDQFVFKVAPVGTNKTENELIRRMHKAIAIIRFKLEGQTIKRNPSYGLDDRLLLEHIDYEKGTVIIDGKEYELLDKNFPTIDPADPYKLTDKEQDVIDRLCSSFIHCDKLQKHVQLLLKKGSMYKKFNGNLLYHGCVPMMEDGTFARVNIYGKEYSGKALFDVLDTYVRKAFFSRDKKERRRGMDILWYIWTAPYSPLYGREKMATFERYFIADPDVHIETKNCYFQLINNPEIADKIFEDFGLSGENIHIINGHVPVHRMRGESPVKCDGKVILIDGGFSKTYRKRTGIAGYTLIFNSYGLTLTAHEPFVSSEEAIRKELDIVSKREAVEYLEHRMLIGDTDNGKKMKEKIQELKTLIKAYQSGEIIEKDYR